MLLYKCQKMPYKKANFQLRAAVGISKTTEVEDLVNGLFYSDLQDTACLQWWQQNEAARLPRVLQAKLLLLLPRGEYGTHHQRKFWLYLGLPVGGGSFPLNQFFSIRYLTPPATSTAVERLFSAAGLIMEAKRNRLCPEFVDKFLFLREAHLLGICKLDWQ